MADQRVKVFVDSTIAPPAPGPSGAGNPVVPAGYFLQPTSDGAITMSSPNPALDNFQQHYIPYFSGGFPAYGIDRQLIGPGL